MMVNKQEKTKSIYARGADDGFLLGAYFVVLFLLSVLGFGVPVVSIAATVMALGVPLLCFFFLRRSQVAAHGLLTFSALWMQGIVMFGCASLIFGAAGLVYMKWVDPDFVMRAVDAAIGLYDGVESDGAKAAAAELELVRQNPELISPVNVAFGWMWLGMFSGSILSMVVAAVVKLRRPASYK